MPGDIKQEYRASSNLTVTGLHSLAASSNLLVGWTSGLITNVSNKDLDVLVSAYFTTASANRQAGAIQVYAYTRLDDSTWPVSLFSAGTPGVQGAATIVGVEQRNEAMKLLWSTATTATNGAIHNMPPSSVRWAFSGYIPHEFALFITANCASGTSACFAASGNQVTIKGAFESYTG